MTRKFLFTAWIALASASLATAQLADPGDQRQQQVEGERLFALHINGILAEKCNSCHGEDLKEIKGGFNLLTREGLLKGGETSEKVLVPGKPEQSLLMTAIRWEDSDYEMPPKENDRLTENQIALIERWIKLEAPWPDEEIREKYILEERSTERTEEGILIKTSGGLGEAWTYRRYQEEDLWAFRPVKKEKMPEGVAPHPIDAFVGQKLRAAKVEPAPMAEPQTLIRRATFDLTGLPPKPVEIARFREAWDKDSEKTWSELVDRLLASPHYGERWGQHWLDVARYADTAGFSNDYERSNAWRYRDYVIRSLNQDKPFNQFIIEQLAGDEMASSEQADFKISKSEATIATGFLRMGPWGTAMVPQKVARQMYLDDVVDNVGQAFLSTPMSCCKCHDHKFDPIPTRDYYGMYAAFSATQPAELPAPFLDGENRDGFDENKVLVEKLLGNARQDEARLVKKREDAARKWYADRDKKYVPYNERMNHPQSKKPPRHFGMDHTDEGTLKVREQDVRIWTRRMERYQPMAQSVYNGPDYKYNGKQLRKKKKADGSWTGKSFILQGGSIEAPGTEVTPSVLSVAGPEAKLPEELEGRRLALAKWVADPANPLSTRSIVNRVWAYHFGRGISATPNNFGAKGAKPSHPELLDWLTDDFVRNGWKLKRLHRLIMTSATYRQSVSHPKMEELKTADPDNELLAYARPRRLTAEEVRDGLLAISGELNTEMGGLPIMPEINMEVALQPRMIQFSIAPAHQPSARPGQRNRRSIYAYRVRGQADPFLEIFNQPNPNKSCEHRDAAAVSPQAFTLMNSDVMTDRSIALALRLQKHSDKFSAQIGRAFRLTLGRAPEKEERLRLFAYAKEMLAYHEEHPPAPVVYPTNVTRSLVEEFSGKPFEYTEWLPVYQDYTPDQKPADVDAFTRALADVCLLLFNSNEFIYVY